MIQEIIDEALKSREQHEPSGLIRPSSLGQCYRRQYWSRKGEKPSNPIDERTMRVFKCGNIFEEFVVKNILSKHPDWQTQIEVNKDDIHGYADLVTPDEVDDVKSQHSRKFWHNDREMKAGGDIRAMFYNNWLQVLTYAWILVKPKARLIYISKDDLCIQEYVQELDNYWLNEIDMELAKDRYYWDFKTLPPAEPRLYGGIETKKECEYCQFFASCDAVEHSKKGSVILKGEEKYEKENA